MGGAKRKDNLVFVGHRYILVSGVGRELIKDTSGYKQSNSSILVRAARLQAAKEVEPPRRMGSVQLHVLQLTPAGPRRQPHAQRHTQAGHCGQPLHAVTHQASHGLQQGLCNRGGHST